MKLLKQIHPTVILGGIILLAAFLRFYALGTNPPGLYIDEASIGYNAYTIIARGVDEHNVPYPVWFESFGEYKMPGYIYGTSLSMLLFGKNEFAVRFFSALTGFLTVPLLYFIVKNLLAVEKKKFSLAMRTYVPLLAAFLLAISPWHIHFSRGGFEITAGVFFYVLGSYLFHIFLNKKQTYLVFLSYLFIILSIYTYHAFRVITPITVLIITFDIFRWKLLKGKALVALFVMSALLILPIIEFSLTAKGSARFHQTSAFSEYPVKSLLEKVLTYPMVFLKNYLSFFSFHFLFSFGDGIGRHQIPGFGLLWRWQLPFLVAGFMYLFKKGNTRLFRYVLYMLLIAPIPAALARPSPHSLRSLLMVIPLTIIITLGIYFVFTMIKKYKYLAASILILIMFFEFSYYIHYYYAHYPKVNAADWGGPSKQMVEKIQQYRKRYPYIIIDNYTPYAYDYFRFYDDSIKTMTVPQGWEIPKWMDKDKILFVRPYYGQKENKNIIDTVYFDNVNHDVYVQFWSVEP